MEEQNNQQLTLQQISKNYDLALSRTNQIEMYLNKIFEHGDSDALQQLISKENYLQLLGNLLYVLNSTVHSYCQLSNKKFPQEIQLTKVKEYFMMIKQTLKPKQLNPIQVNVKAAKRIIQSTINQNR